MTSWMKIACLVSYVCRVWDESNANDLSYIPLNIDSLHGLHQLRPPSLATLVMGCYDVAGHGDSGFNS